MATPSRSEQSFKLRIIVVTNDIDEALAFAAVMCVLDNGDCLQTGPPGDVLSAPANERVREALDLPLVAAL